MMTLIELNAAAVRRGSDAVYNVGKSGTTHAGTSGAKVHLLMTYTSGTRKATVSCTVKNGSRAMVIPGADTEKVTCSKCIEWLQRSEAIYGK